MGLTHPKRSLERGRESIINLRVLLHAIRARDAALAEKTIREEVSEAAEEVNRLLKDEFTKASGAVRRVS